DRIDLSLFAKRGSEVRHADERIEALQAKTLDRAFSDDAIEARAEQTVGFPCDASRRTHAHLLGDGVIAGLCAQDESVAGVTRARKLHEPTAARPRVRERTIGVPAALDV